MHLAENAAICLKKCLKDPGSESVATLINVALEACSSHMSMNFHPGSKGGLKSLLECMTNIIEELENGFDFDHGSFKQELVRIITEFAKNIHRHDVWIFLDFFDDHNPLVYLNKPAVQETASRMLDWRGLAVYYTVRCCPTFMDNIWY